MNENVWCILELMGHVRLAGRLSEEEKFGTKMGRLDIPVQGGCTGVSANWCPQCGDCICKDDEDKNDEACPLHRSGSKHGECQEDDFVTQLFGGASVYRITIVTEAVARQVAKQATAAPVSPWDFPRQLTAKTVERVVTDDDEEPPCDEEDDPLYQRGSDPSVPY